MNVRDAFLRVNMPDGTEWDVPVEKIARHRAKHYKGEFGTIKQSLEVDTWPLFEQSGFEIIDWAANNMNWSDVRRFAELVERPKVPKNYQEGWVNGPKRLVY